MSSQMTVGQISDVINRNERRIHTTLGDVSVSDGGTEVTVTLPGEDGAEPTVETFDFDEVAERKLGQFLDVSPVYLAKCPSSLKAYNLNYWLQHQDRRETEATIIAGPEGGIEAVHDPDKTVVTIPEMAQLITKVFKPEDEIVRLISDPTTFHADVVSQLHKITVPGNGVGDRPDADGVLHRPGQDPLDVLETEAGPVTQDEPRVFDITQGGIRIRAYPNKAKSPVMERYFERYICANGATMVVPEASIKLRGKTVEEVMESMEEAAEFLLGSMDEQLERYRELANVPVPGNPILFIQQLGREQGIPANIIEKAIDYAGGAGFGRSDVPVSSYDVMQIFTSLANGEGVRYSTQLKLQSTGGVFVHRGDDLMHRCVTCERPLIGN